MTEAVDLFRYRPGTGLANYSTLHQVSNAREQVQMAVLKLAELQEKLYADNRYALLLIFQGMDAAGKDSTIKHVTSGVNPAGFQVFSFQHPTYKEVDHNFLWRYWRAMPERGRIGIFNRSYYEEVLVVRVHPEIIEQRRIPHEHVNGDFWTNRFEDFRALEKHLYQNGTIVLKFFLNVSKAEQKARLLRRLRRPDKHWKFDPRDLDEREHWNDYQAAYQDAIAATHCERAPWFVVPADDKWTMRAIVAHILCAELERLNLDYPTPEPGFEAVIAEATQRLTSEEE